MKTGPTCNFVKVGSEPLPPMHCNWSLNLGNAYFSSKYPIMTSLVFEVMTRNNETLCETVSLTTKPTSTCVQNDTKFNKVPLHLE